MTPNKVFRRCLCILNVESNAIPDGGVYWPFWQKDGKFGGDLGAGTDQRSVEFKLLMVVVWAVLLIITFTKNMPMDWHKPAGVQISMTYHSNCKKIITIEVLLHHIAT